MNKEEPSLFTHLNEIRTKAIPEGGLSNVIYWLVNSIFLYLLFVIIILLYLFLLIIIC